MKHTQHHTPQADQSKRIGRPTPGVWLQMQESAALGLPLEQAARHTVRFYA